MTSSARRLGTDRAQRFTPHSLETEESLLGAMLLSKDAIADAVEICQSADFYKPSHQHIFEALTSIWNKGEPVDSMTVADELKRKNVLEEVGGVPQLLKLQADTPAISNASSYAVIVVEYSFLRRLLRAANDIAERVYEVPDDVDEVIDWAEALIFEVARKRHTDTVVRLDTLTPDVVKQVLDVAKNPGAISGLTTGFTDLDGILSGIRPSNLLIIGGRPTMGKTAFALGLAADVVIRQRLPVLLFSLEMGNKEIAQRLVSMEGMLDATKMKKGPIKQEELRRLTDGKIAFDGVPFYMHGESMVTVMDIRAKARRMKAQHGLGLIVVDYLQLMSVRGRAENRQAEISEISRGLKILARELEVPIIALSQLSRNLEMRTDKRPMLSDLRESGSLEQDADVVLFIYRDEVYYSDSPDKGTAEIIVAKHRSGPTGIARLAFIDSFTKFANLAIHRESF